MNRISIFINNHVSLFVPIFLILIIATAEMATSIYAPSLASVANYFGVSESQIQGTISINLFGLAFSGLFYGPFSDSFGRRAAFRVGIGCFLLGALGRLLASTFEVLILFRLIQGMGEGVTVVVSFAMIQDLFAEKKRAVILSYMGMAISLSPGLAPILGGYLTYHYGWRMCFGVMSLAAISLLFLLFFGMPESLSPEKRSIFSLKGVLLAYGKALKNKLFIGAALVPSMMIGSLWAWMASTPILYVNYLDVSLQEYGYYAFFGIIMYVLGTLINGHLVNRYSLKSLLLSGIWMCLSSSVLLLIVGLIGEDNNAMLLQGLCAPFAFGLAFVFANGTTLAFSKVTEQQGTCSALLGSLEMGMGAFSIALMGNVFNGSIVPIAVIMFSFTLVGLILSYQE